MHCKILCAAEDIGQAGSIQLRGTIARKEVYLREAAVKVYNYQGMWCRKGVRYLRQI